MLEVVGNLLLLTTKENLLKLIWLSVWEEKLTEMNVSPVDITKTWSCLSSLYTQKLQREIFSIDTWIER